MPLRRSARRRVGEARLYVIRAVSIPLVFACVLLAGGAAGRAASVQDAELASAQADALAAAGQEREAAGLYLDAHIRFQRILLASVEEMLRGSFGAPVDEEAVTRAAGRAAALRNINLSKLWILVDPDDRAFQLGLEAERADLIRRFPSFRTPASAQPLEEFLHRLYPDDVSGERQMESLRGETMPFSKRWARLEAARRQP
ncbi:hypothetical protein [Candidatus Nitrospira bockiana]